MQIFFCFVFVLFIQYIYMIPDFDKVYVVDRRMKWTSRHICLVVCVIIVQTMKFFFLLEQCRIYIYMWNDPKTRKMFFFRFVLFFDHKNFYDFKFCCCCFFLNSGKFILVSWLELNWMNEWIYDSRSFDLIYDNNLSTMIRTKNKMKLILRIRVY